MKTPAAPHPWAALALAALALSGLVLAYFGLLHWWLVAPWWHDHQAVSELQREHTRLASRLAQQPQWQRRLQRLRHDPGQGLLPESEPGAAAAGLMQRIVESVARHGSDTDCEVIQKMPQEVTDASPGGFREVRVNISLRCEAEPLAEVLYDLEYGRPYLFVTDFVMYQPLALPSPGRIMHPEVQLTVAGYLRAAPAAGARP